MPAPTLLYLVNVDWYFRLHWLARATAARDRGYRVHVAAAPSDADCRAAIEGLGLGFHPLPLQRRSMNPWREWHTRQALSHLISTLAPDLVHSITVKPNLYASGVCRRLGIPQVMGVTGLGQGFSGTGLRARLAGAYMRRAYRGSLRGRERVRAIFENQDDRDLFLRLGLARPEQTVLIPGAGVDLARYGPAAAGHERAPAPRRAPRALFAARLLRSKGLADLVAASDRLRARDVAHELWVAGIPDRDNADAIPLDQIRRWQTEGRLRWLGQVNDMPGLLREVDLVCLPTRYGEGVPRILLEGAASGLPLIATDTVGCRDIVWHGETGLRVAPGDIAQLADAIATLAGDPALRQRLGARGRRLVAERFAQEQVIAATLDVYARMLGQT